MTKEKIIAWLEANKDERSIAHFQKLSGGKQKSYGVGLTKLKGFAKKIKKNHLLAAGLWKENNYDCRIMAILIDDPKQVTRDQIASQMKEKMSWIFSYVYCSALLKEVPFVMELILEWIPSKDNLLRRSGYLLLYQFARKDKKQPDGFYLNYLNIIKEQIKREENFVKDAMNSALLSMGMRNPVLHQRALAIARSIGKIEVDYGDNSCKAVDVAQHLTGNGVMHAMERMKMMETQKVK